MPILTTTTGSYPHREKVRGGKWRSLPPDKAIERAIRHQLEAGIDLLVDGQVRSDIAGLIAPALNQVRSDDFPFRVVGKISAFDSSALLDDYYRARELADQLGPKFDRTGSIAIKAHITGPTFVAQSCQVWPGSPYRTPAQLAEGGYGYDVDPALVLDIARALVPVVAAYAAAGASYIQVDEPTLAYGADISTALAAIKELRAGAPHGTWILHSCGDIRTVFAQLLAEAPVDVLFVEGEFLREIRDLNGEQLRQVGKQVLYGCLPVDTDVMPSAQKLARELDDAVERFSSENLFGISPYCGLRLTTPEIAKAKMRRLVEGAKAYDQAG